MKPNIQPNVEPDTEQFFPGEEPFSRQKRERQRQVALYLTLIVGAVLLTVGVTLRYTLLAEAYKPAPYQPPLVASITPEEPEEVVATPEPVKVSASSAGGSTTELPSNIRETYFKDAPDGINTLTAAATPTPAPTPSALLPDAVETPSVLGEPVTVGAVIKPIEIVPISRNVTPSVRLFELPNTQPAELPKMNSTSKGSSKTTAPKTQGELGGLKVNITTPTITTIPGVLSQPGTGSVQPASGLPSAQSGTTVPSSGSASTP